MGVHPEIDASGRRADAGNQIRAGTRSRSNGINIPLAGIDLSERECAYVIAALSDGWISGTGPFIARFEQALSKRVHRTHTVAVANGTLALELALRALEVGPGDEVIVPALTFAAPAMSALAVGATVVLADVTPETWTLSPEEVARKMSRRTRAIIAVDVLGHPADYDELVGFGVPVIEDAAEAHGALYKGQPAGSLGDVAVFSFHANKPVTTGEGGSVSTDSVALAERMRLIAHHGMRPEEPYVHEVVGRNYRMTNLTAALGLGQLDRWSELVASRRDVAARYDKLLDGVECGMRPVAAWAEPVCWLYTLTVDNRPEVLREIRAAGVDARGIWPAPS